MPNRVGEDGEKQIGFKVDVVLSGSERIEWRVKGVNDVETPMCTCGRSPMMLRRVADKATCRVSVSSEAFVRGISDLPDWSSADMRAWGWAGVESPDPALVA